MNYCLRGRRHGSHQQQGRVHGQPVRLPEVSLLLPLLAAGGGTVCLPHCDRAHPAAGGSLGGGMWGYPAQTEATVGGGRMGGSAVSSPPPSFLSVFFIKTHPLVIPLVAMQGGEGRRRDSE